MFNVKYLHKGHKINISFVRMILQCHLKQKMPTCVFKWFVQYPSVEHKICMLNEKNMMMIFLKRKLENKTNCDKL
jgi:hypothetical protein